MEDKLKFHALVQARLKAIGEKIDAEMPVGWGYAVIFFAFGQDKTCVKLLSSAEKQDVIKLLNGLLERLNGEF